MKIKNILILMLVLCLFALSSINIAAQVKPINDLKPTVILISLDGFRYDYLDKYQPPFMNQLAKTGVRAKWMIPSFPTKTFPNHYAIATGLYPEHNGLVANDFFGFDTVFSPNNLKEVEKSRWWLGEPIWVTAAKQRQIAASYFYPGSTTVIEDILPAFYRRYNGKVPRELIVDTTLSQLDLPVEKRPTVYTLYFPDTDEVGHEFSPDSIEMKYTVLEVDNYVKRLYDGLRARKIDGKVNLIIVSDHGMATVNFKNAVFLDDSFNFGDAERIVWNNEFVQIYPKQDKEDEIYNKIKTLQHTTCWKKADIPARLHYNDSPRIAPIVCSSEEGWVTTSHERYDKAKDDDNFEQPHGAHGYDNKYQSMQATFIAHGAAFKQGFTAEPFENVAVYDLICKILGLTPAKNDGDFNQVKDMLR